MVLRHILVKDDLLDDPVLGGAVIGHNCGSLEKLLNLLPLILFAQLLALAVHISDLFEDSLLVDDLGCGVDFQEQSPFESAEVGCESLVDEEIGVWDGFLGFGIKELPGLPNLHEIELLHGCPQIVVQESQLGLLVLWVAVVETD